jgi:uncharacterized protein
MKIKIILGNKKLVALLYDNKTAKEIYNILPIESRFNKWGDEIYFEIPLHLELDSSAKNIVEKGELGFWPSGNAFCIFWGKTPASKGDGIRPASAVNVFGKIIEGIENLENFDADRVIIEKI